LYPSREAWQQCHCFLSLFDFNSVINQSATFLVALALFPRLSSLLLLLELTVYVVECLRFFAFLVSLARRFSSPAFGQRRRFPPPWPWFFPFLFLSFSLLPSRCTSVLDVSRPPSRTSVTVTGIRRTHIFTYLSSGALLLFTNFHDDKYLFIYFSLCQCPPQVHAPLIFIHLSILAFICTFISAAPLFVIFYDVGF
jgi:hypothetical protein